MNQRPSTATLVGYYAHRNLGDDLYAHQFVNALRQKGYERIYLPLATRVLRDTLDLPQPPRLLHCVRQSDLVLYGGGGGLGLGNLNHSRPKEFRFLRNLCLASMLFRTPIHLLSVGIGPFNHRIQRRDMRAVLKSAANVTVREPRSLEEVSSLGLPAGTAKLIPDAAASQAIPIPTPETATPQTDGPCLGINLTGSSSFPDADAPAFCRAIIDAAQAGLADGKWRRIRWFSTDRRGQELHWACRGHHATAAASEVVVYDDNPGDWLARLGQCCSFLSMKLHSAIYALRLGVPICGIAYHPKIARTYRMLDGMEYLLEINQCHPGDVIGFLDRQLPGLDPRTSKRWQEVSQEADAHFAEIPQAPQR